MAAPWTPRADLRAMVVGPVILSLALLGAAFLSAYALAHLTPEHRPLARALGWLFAIGLARAVAHPWQDVSRAAWALDVAGFVAAYVVATGAVWRALGRMQSPLGSRLPSGASVRAFTGRGVREWPRKCFALTPTVAAILPALALLSTFALAYALRPHLRGAPIAWLCGSPTTGQPGALPVFAAAVQLAALVRWGAGRKSEGPGSLRAPRHAHRFRPDFPRSSEVPIPEPSRASDALPGGARRLAIDATLPPRPAPVTPSVVCALILAGSAVADGVIRLVPLEWARQMRVNAVAWGCIMGVQAWALWRARKARNVI